MASGAKAGVPPTNGYPPKLKKFHLFLRNCKVIKKYELETYTLYYMLCGKEQLTVECDKENNCIEVIRIKLG